MVAEEVEKKVKLALLALTDSVPSQGLKSDVVVVLVVLADGQVVVVPVVVDVKINKNAIDGVTAGE
jgi:hypothetical protein